LQLFDNQKSILPSESRFSTHPSLRVTAKNSITTFNALQKVFRTRFDEGRMNAKISHFGNMGIKQSFVNAGRLPYETLLGKNKESFFKPVYYSTTIFKNLNQYGSLFNSSKVGFFDFPFLLSEKSESTMYM